MKDLQAKTAIAAGGSSTIGHLQASLADLTIDRSPGLSCDRAYSILRTHVRQELYDLILGWGPSRTAGSRRSPAASEDPHLGSKAGEGVVTVTRLEAAAQDVARSAARVFRRGGNLP